MINIFKVKLNKKAMVLSVIITIVLLLTVVHAKADMQNGSYPETSIDYVQSMQNNTWQGNNSAMLRLNSDTDRPGESVNWTCTNLPGGQSQQCTLYYDPQQSIGLFNLTFTAPLSVKSQIDGFDLLIDLLTVISFWLSVIGLIQVIKYCKQLSDWIQSRRGV